MIYTGNYNNCLGGKIISISGDGGLLVNFNGPSYKDLAPKKAFWTEWHNNIGIIDEQTNNNFYIEKYFELVLKNLDTNKIIRELDNNILLCYEDIEQFCHRYIVAAWLELKTNMLVNEVSSDIYGNITILNGKSIYKEQAKQIIRSKYHS